MYITTDNSRYDGVRIYSTANSVRITGGVPLRAEITDAIHLFADNDFPLCDINPGDYLRQELSVGSWLFTNAPEPKAPEPPVLTPRERREQSYETEPLIEYEGEEITVDEANRLFLRYSAEGNTQKYMALQILIGRAKADVRARFPDGEETTHE